MGFVDEIKPGDELGFAFKNSFRELTVQPDPYLDGLPYVELGRSAHVLQLKEKGSNNQYALKVFKPGFQSEEHVYYTNNLQDLGLHSVNGLAVANRLVIVPDIHDELIDTYEELRYSILMPWIPGFTWQEVLVDNKRDEEIRPFTSQEAFQVAANLCVLLKKLEDSNCAHCDLCGSNVIVNTTTMRVDLIDIEDIYGPGFSRNAGFMGGQRGYGHQYHRHRENHQWCPEGDRFGGAILIAEMMGWHSKDVREMSGEDSFFPSDRDLHESSDRFSILSDALEDQTSSETVDLLVRAWESESLQECPLISDWYNLIAQAAENRGILIPDLVTGANSTGAYSSPVSGIVSRRSLVFDFQDSHKETCDSEQQILRPSASVVQHRRHIQKVDESDKDDQDSRPKLASEPRFPRSRTSDSSTTRGRRDGTPADVTPTSSSPSSRSRQRRKAQVPANAHRKRTGSASPSSSRSRRPIRTPANSNSGFVPSLFSSPVFIIFSIMVLIIAIVVFAISIF